MTIHEMVDELLRLGEIKTPLIKELCTLIGKEDEHTEKWEQLNRRLNMIRDKEDEITGKLRDLNFFTNSEHVDEIREFRKGL